MNAPASKLLRNPICNSLSGRHAEFAIGGRLAKKYISDVAPFAGLAESSAAAFRELSELLTIGEQAFLIGFEGDLPSEMFVSVDHGSINQMVFSAQRPAPDAGNEITALTPQDAGEMLHLTDLAFPGYFRRGTYRLGQYFGIYNAGKLIAMAGERFAPGGFVELSAICTHPFHRGRGFARRLTNVLIDRAMGRGLVPFLHVGQDSEPARALYSSLGFTDSRPVRLLEVFRNDRDEGHF
jgi:ribosomal protein S18 acetylase RimI-like enzyme